jgi:co-chaperonin GroES (HSP10)
MIKSKDCEIDPLQIKPTGNNVLIKMDPVERKVSGLWVLESAWDYVYKGVVVLSGPGQVRGQVRVPTGLHRGDRVYFGKDRNPKSTSTEFTYKGDTYVIESAEHVFAKEEHD